MQHVKRLAFLTLVLCATSAHAGVMMEMVTRDAAGKETDRAKVYAQSEMVRMDQGGGASPASMIFLGDRFLYVDHSEETYIVMDEEALNEVSEKISDAMRQMEAELAKMPPEQRAMVEQMMKGRMKDMMPQQDDAAPKTRVESVGKGKWQSYACSQYAVYEGSQKIQEICAATLDDVAGADEVIAAFISMAEYIEKMTESMPMMANDGLNPGELMAQIKGFPVHTVDYQNGQAFSETSLDSIVEKELDPTLFAAPEGYRRQDPFGSR